MVIGLLTDEGLAGYKKVIIPFKDRQYVLEAIAKGINGVKVVPQDSLNPENNIIKYKCKAIASGDGFEEKELEVIHKLKLKRIAIHLNGEKGKGYSSSAILDRYCQT